MWSCGAKIWDKRINMARRNFINFEKAFSCHDIIISLEIEECENGYTGTAVCYVIIG
jgi:hypothetical protein